MGWLLRISKANLQPTSCCFTRLIACLCTCCSLPSITLFLLLLSLHRCSPFPIVSILVLSKIISTISNKSGRNKCNLGLWLKMWSTMDLEHFGSWTKSPDFFKISYSVLWGYLLKILNTVMIYNYHHIDSMNPEIICW